MHHKHYPRMTGIQIEEEIPSQQDELSKVLYYNLQFLDDKSLLCDINLIRHLESFRIGNQHDALENILSNILDESFPSLFIKVDRMDSRWVNLTNRYGAGTDPRLADLHFSMCKTRKEDFLILWLYNSIYCSKQMLHAMSNRDITIGNIRSQWMAEMMSRMRKRCTPDPEKLNTYFH